MLVGYVFYFFMLVFGQYFQLLFEILDSDVFTFLQALYLFLEACDF